jgi:PmbA protein
MIEKALKLLSNKSDEAEIFKVESKSASIKTKKQAIDSFKEKGAIGYGVRVIKNKKMGFYFTNSLNEKAIDTAVKISKIAERDDYLSFPGKQAYKQSSLHAIEMEVEEGIEMANELVSAGKDLKEVSLTGGTITWGNSKITIANTNDVYGVKSEFTLSAYLGTVATRTEPATGFHFEVSRMKDIDAFEVGTTACRLARDSLDAKGLKTAKRRVILRPMAATELFENTLIPSFSADNVQRGRSKLQGRLGEKPFTGINIIDDATLNGGLMSEPFDDEGVPAQKTVLVDNGALKGFLYDTYTASKEGIESTGNGARPSHAALPGVGPSNFMIEGDNRVDGEDSALIVHGLVGAHTANPISGDFSCETRNAFLDGEPIKKAIVSGNVFDLLKKEVKFGDDKKQYSSVRSPSIELSDVMVVG